MRPSKPALSCCNRRGVKASRPGHPRWSKFATYATNQIRDLRADVVLVADGKGGITAGVSRPKNGDLGVKCHLDGVAGPGDTIELFGLRGHYVGLAAIDGNRWNLAMSVPKRRVASFSGNFDHLLAAACDQNGMLARRLEGARRMSTWHSSPLPRYASEVDWPEGVILIGNAAAALEPIGGEGMGLALASAEKAVDALTHAGQLDLEQLKKSYRDLWDDRRLWCRLAALVSSRPVLAGVAIEVGGMERRLATWVAGRMGKASAVVS